MSNRIRNFLDIPCFVREFGKVSERCFEAAKVTENENIVSQSNAGKRS